MTVSDLINEAVKIAGSQAKLGESTGFSQNAIFHAIRAGRASAEMANEIHRFTDGKVPRWALRPDLWERPLDIAANGVAELPELREAV